MPTQSLRSVHRWRAAAAALLAMVIAAAVGLALGPRARVGAPRARAALPAEVAALPGWLAARETALPGLRGELVTRVRWAGAPGARTQHSVIYLHGYTASPRELSPVVEDLAAALAANALFMRLAGHGQDAEAMAGVRAEDWLGDAEEALAIGRSLGDKVIVVGMSTGATLGTWLAARAPDLEALILLSPNWALKDPAARLLTGPYGVQVARLVLGPYYEYKPRTPLQAQRWTPRSRVEGLVQMAALVDLVAKIDLRPLHMPTLVVYTPDDEAIDARRVMARFAEIGAPRKRLVPLLGARHVLAGEAVAPENNDRLLGLMLTFLREGAAR